MGNGSAGIEFYFSGSNSARGFYIGGVNAGEGNVIRGNSGDGVWVQTGSQAAIRGDAIFGNGGLGIDVASNGVTANDGAKTTGQPNQLMDHPVFSSAVLAGNTLTVAGYIGTATGQSTFANSREEVFKSDGDATGFGEGQVYLGFLTADANGNFAGSLDVTGMGLVVSNTVTGTATDTSNYTSEFGANFTVTLPSISGTVFEDVNYGGGAGRSRSVALAAGGSGRSGARVELFTVSGSVATYSTLTTADGSGHYSFAGLAPGNYAVRVVSSTVSSARSGYTASLLRRATSAANRRAVRLGRHRARFATQPGP